MKKIACLSLFGFLLLCGCAPNRWFLINSDGVLTYNRHTGQLEVMWDHSEKPNPAVVRSDSLKVDTLKN